MTSYLSREKFKALYGKYERHITSGALVFGFLVDNFTLKRIDLLFENLVLFGYLALAGVGIIFANLYTGGIVKGRFSEKVYLWAPLAMQYAFGGLFSGFLIFYTRSASLIASWPFLVFLVVLLVGNEFLKKRYQRLSFQMAVYFVAIFSFAIFYVPILLGTMGVWVFLLSGVVSLIVMGMILYVLSRIIPERIRESKKILLVGIGSIFAAINIFYFTNIIPPIPLSLKEAGVYHFVERANGNYLVRGEVKEWYDFLRFSDEIHIAPGEAVYVWSAVFFRQLTLIPILSTVGNTMTKSKKSGSQPILWVFQSLAAGMEDIADSPLKIMCRLVCGGLGWRLKEVSFWVG